ncbi:hypothetical protein T265_13753, partial [Opisthorchis viverrini]
MLLISKRLKCCGVTGAEDFTGSKSFDNQFVTNEGTIESCIDSDLLLAVGSCYGQEAQTARDWLASLASRRTPIGRKSGPNSQSRYVLRYPVSCCKRKGNYDKLPNKCPEVFDERNSYIKTGCWPLLEGQVLSALTKVSFIVIFTILIE